MKNAILRGCLIFSCAVLAGCAGALYIRGEFEYDGRPEKPADIRPAVITPLTPASAAK